MAKPTIYGPAYSTFARACRLALEEKGADYDLIEVDILSGANQTPEHLARQPFGKVPAFEHDGLKLYETDAIVRYIDDVFPGSGLVPPDAASRARMTQAMSVIGNYAYPCMIGQIFIQRAVMPMIGNTSDEEAIAAAVPQAETSVAALEELINGNAYLAGDGLSLADLVFVPVYDYLSQTPEGQKILESAPNLRRWWDTVSTRPSVEATKPALG
ncbi:MAG: glutathione S-transferase family protein [Pseudomonadota bacterium]